MKKSNYIIKFIGILLLSFIIITFTCLNTVTATNYTVKSEPETVSLDVLVDQLEFDEEYQPDNKILKYDAKTGETTEIDMNNLKSKLSKNNVITNYVEPYMSTQTNGINEISLNSNYIYPLDTQNFPYTATCKIKCEVYGKVGVSSGFLVGKNLLLTAAHCVMNKEDGDKTFAQWKVYPGYVNGKSYKNLSSTYVQAIYPSDWKKTHSPEYDWCLCILEDDIGLQTNYYGAQAYGTNNEMNGLSVSPYGYPTSEYNGERLCYSNGNILNTYNMYFDSSAYVSEGMSGGPFTRSSDGYAVGITHGYYTSNPNISVASRITQDVINLIVEYRNK